MTATPTAPAARTRGPNPITEFFAGVATLARGFGYFRRRPGTMALGLIPAAIVFGILVVLIVLLVANLDPVTIFLTGFAESWDEGWRNLLRIGFGLALVVGLIVLYAFAFTALTLIVGDWFYQRIWRIVEADLGDFTAGPEPGFWRSSLDAARLVVRAIVTGVLIVLLGLVPLIGTVLAVVLGTFLSGRVVALELTTRPLEARGMTRQQRRAALRSHSARVLGFGVAVHLCFLIPGGAILVMPAAVAGATLLARHALGAAPPLESRTSDASTP
jgi:CysZ protein